MLWVVDTSVLLDIALGDPEFGKASAKVLEKKRKVGLAVSPISEIELSPQFAGSLLEVRRFLTFCDVSHSGVKPSLNWSEEDTQISAELWNDYIAARRAKQKNHTQPLKRPIADLLILGFAMRFGGLISRDRDYGWFNMTQSRKIEILKI